jgi:ATP-dependent DNA ligase
MGQEETNGTATRRKGLLAKLLRGSHLSIVLNEYFEENGAVVFREACRLRSIVSKRLGSPYRSGQVAHRTPT